MPVVLPALAGLGAVLGAGALGYGAIIGGSFLATGLVIGAVTGAVVGGIQSAIQGGDLMEGVLYGAVGGAVGGALGGVFNSFAYGSMVADPTGGGYSTTGKLAGADSAIYSSKPGSLAAEGMVTGEAGGALGLSSDTKLLLASGAMGMLNKGSTPEQAEAMSIEEQKELLKFQTDEAIRQGEALKPDDPRYAIAELQVAQAEKESIRNAELARERLASEESQLKDQLSQRQRELEKPYIEEAKKRARILDTAQGFYVKRQDSGGSGAQESQILKIDQTPNYQEQEEMVG